MSKEVVSNPAAHRAAPLEAAESKQRTTQRDGAAQEMHRDSYIQDKGQEKSLDKGQEKAQEKAQEKGPLSERTDNKSVADAADFSSKPKGSPEERELRKVLDDVRRDGSLVAPEKQLKSLIDLRRMHSPNETGLHHQEVGKFSTRQEYNPADRPDRLQRFTRQDINGAETITRDYHGRVDQLLQEESARGKNSQSYKRVFQEGKGPEGLTSEEYARVNGDKLVEAFKKVYDPKANAEGLKEHSWTKTDKGEITIKDFAGRKDGLVSFENVDKGADGTVKSRIFANRADKLISEKEVSKGDESSIARKYSDGAIERIKTGADKSVDRTRTNADGTSIVEHTSGDGKSRETQVRDSKNRVISINGEDPRGKYVASEIAGEGRDVITQRKYVDGTIVTKFPDGKSGPQGAREVVQEAGKQPRLFDAQGKEISTPKHKGDAPDKGPLEVATRFNENGTVQKTFADGSNTLTSLKDHVEKSSPATLGKEVRDLTKLAKTGSTDTSSAAINGLFKALQSEHQVPGQPEKFFSAKFALQELRTGSNTAPIVQAEALNQLASPDSHTRSVSANLVANNVEHWGPKDVKAITSNPSIEMATALSKLTPEQLKPHKSTIEEGVKEAAKHDPAETVDATRGKFGAIGVLAATGGAEALKAAGYDVKDVNNFAVIETKNGIKLTFDKQPNSALRLRSAEGPGKMDGDSESASFDAGTGEISKLTTKDRYGEFTERAFKDTERGLVRQRSYDKSKLVRTIFEGNDKEGKSGNMEVQHIPGKPPVVIDAKGDKATAPTNAAIPLATSFEDPQQPKTVFSDGSVLTRPIKDYVGMSDGKELAKHADKFETLAVNGSEPAKQAGIDALVKLYAGENPEHFKAAQEALVRLSAKGLGGEIGKSILESQSGRQRLSRESAATNKTVSLIAATAGYPGLAGAGLKIDHDNNTGTLADGTRYEFGTTDKGRMQPISMVDKEGKRHDFDYNEAGQMTGKHLSDRQGDGPNKRTTDNSWSKYEGMKMPSIQKGWGPYQALEQMRSEGKIEMSGKEMKAVAEFIRDRDFAKSGEKFYKTGDKLEMPNAAELAKIKAGVGSAPDRAENRADDSSARRQRRESESQPDAATRRDTRRRSRSRGIEPHVPGSERDERRDAPERETDRDRGYRPDGRDKSEEPYDGGAADGVNMRRTFNDRKTFFRAQNDSHSCSAFAMGMMAADHLKGSPISDKEATGFKKLAGTTSHGYRGSLDDMASQLKSVGLNTKAYKFDKFGDEEMKALNAELDKGHTAVARVQNDRTGNSHYIYVAGRDNDGNYIIGDPDRRNKNNKGPISPERLKKLMSNRMPDGGFVAGWAAKEGKAENIPGSIAFRNAQTRNSKEGDHYRNSRRRDDAGRDDAERRAARDDQKQAPGQVRLKGGLRPVVVIDAGHGGHDSGSTVKGTMEKTITQDIATRVSKYLNKLGIAVERTNPHGGFRALSERSSFANRILGKEDGRRSSDRQIADAFVSIHANDDGVNSRGGGRARGFQTYFHRAKSDDGSSELADTIHSTVVKSDGLDVRDAGKNSKKNFHVIREPKSPAVLLETGFLTNDRDRANLSKPEYRDSMAKRIALGIARYLNGRNPRTKP